MNKKRLIELANQLQYAELFEELAKLDLNISKRGLEQLLREEYLTQGSSNIDFHQRVSIFIETLDTDENDNKLRFDLRYFILLALTIVLLALTFIFRVRFVTNGKLSDDDISIFLITLSILISLTLSKVIYDYLQGLRNNFHNKFISHSHSSLPNSELKKLKKDIINEVIENIEKQSQNKNIGINIEEISEQNLNKAVNEIENRIRQHNLKLGLADDDFKRLVESGVERIKNLSNKDIKNEKRYEEVVSYLQTDKSRLKEEIKSLNRKANLNLSIAVFTTTLVIGLLSTIYLDNKEYKDIDNWFRFSGYFLPRFSLVVIIELFSYYFLTMYRASLHEIKYYQNELTDIEHKNTALRIALLSDTKDIDIKYIVEQLLKTDKNRVMQKDETTVELEMYKSDRNLFTEFNTKGQLIKVFENWFKKNKEEEKETKEDNKD